MQISPFVILLLGLHAAETQVNTVERKRKRIFFHIDLYLRSPASST